MIGSTVLVDLDYSEVYLTHKQWLTFMLLLKLKSVHTHMDIKIGLWPSLYINFWKKDKLGKVYPYIATENHHAIIYGSTLKHQ